MLADPARDGDRYHQLLQEIAKNQQDRKNLTQTKIDIGRQNYTLVCFFNIFYFTRYIN